MKKLVPVFAAVALVLFSSTAWAGWGYSIRGPVVVARPAVPVVTYYAPAIPAVPAPVVTASPVVTPAPVVESVPAPTPVLTPDALIYPAAVVYPAPAVRVRVQYRPVRPVYGIPAYGIIVP